MKRFQKRHVVRDLGLYVGGVVGLFAGFLISLPLYMANDGEFFLGFTLIVVVSIGIGARVGRHYATKMAKLSKKDKSVWLCEAVDLSTGNPRMIKVAAFDEYDAKVQGHQQGFGVKNATEIGPYNGQPLDEETAAKREQYLG